MEDIILLAIRQYIAPISMNFTDIPSTMLFSQKRKYLTIIIFTVITSFLLSACSVFGPTPISRGSLVEKDDYDQLIPKSSTKADAIDLMGSPTTKGAFDDNTWIYISMTTHLAPIDFPAISKQQVVVLKFADTGLLENVRVLNKKDAVPVAMSNKVTPTPGTKINILQQILGNVGRYDPMQSMMGSGAMGANGSMFNNNTGPGHFGSGNSL